MRGEEGKQLHEADGKRGTGQCWAAYQGVTAVLGDDSVEYRGAAVPVNDGLASLLHTSADSQ